MEFAAGGEFTSVVEAAKKEPLQENIIYQYFTQLVLALISVHDKGINHGDVKPANIVIMKKGKREVKLADFGSARNIGESLL
jgi:serine/threonine protein kinase